jgi:hypothetical protein
MSAEPLLDTRQQYLELTDEFIEGVARKFFSILPATMTPEQQEAAIESTASFIRDVDALIARVDLLDANTQAAIEADLVRNRLKAMRSVAWLAMKELNPDQAWFWTEAWQAGQRAADADIAAGCTRFHASTDDFLASLDAWHQSHAHA